MGRLNDGLAGEMAIDMCIFMGDRLKMPPRASDEWLSELLN